MQRYFCTYGYIRLDAQTAYSLLLVVKKASLDATELAVWTRVDCRLLYDRLLVVPGLARRGWFHGGGRTAERLRRQSRHQLVVDADFLRSSQDRLGTSRFIHLHTYTHPHTRVHSRILAFQSISILSC